MTIEVDDVATDSDLDTYVGGSAVLQGLLPEEWHDEGAAAKWARPARSEALATALRTLAARRPPIRETDLVDATELKMCVVYGALEIIYRNAIEHEGGPNQSKAKAFGSKFAAEIAALQPSVAAGSTASSMSIRISRG